MPKVLALAIRYRVAALALAFSALLHATLLVGGPARFEARDPEGGAVYSASLDLKAPVVRAGDGISATSPAPKRLKPKPPPRAHHPPPPPAPAIEEAPLALAELATPLPPAAAVENAPQPEAAPSEAAPAAPMPDVVALAEPSAPLATAPEPFPAEALPGRVRINYSLTSALADGFAFYEWRREGDHYTIRGEAKAVGFFALFLEGAIQQESNGMVTNEGLRPERFSELRPNSAPEGLGFDWPAHQVTF